jgi:RNA polymerase sigma-70 factor (ECF subfamily)
MAMRTSLNNQFVKCAGTGTGLLDAYASTRQELVGALTRMLGSSDDALDVVQITFLKCWRARAQLQGVRDLKAWVFRVGLNAGRDLRRDAWRRRSRPLERARLQAACDPADPVAKEERIRVRSALCELRPVEREVFLLRQEGGHTYAAIADRCGAPVGTIKTRMRSALIKLRHVLRDRSL